MPSKWSDLPTEILQNVFQQYPLYHYMLTQYTDWINCASVCKNWKRVAESLLYKDVQIRSIYGHLIFFRTVSNSSKGTLVKRLELKYDSKSFAREEPEVFATMFNNMPCLQEFASFKNFSYSPLIDAIMDGKLPELNVIGGDYGLDSVDNYITCFMLIKDRLKTIQMQERDDTGLFDRIGKVYFDRLLDRQDQLLNQPNAITNYSASKRSVCDEVEYLENVVSKCKHLTNLHLSFKRDSTEHADLQEIREGIGQLPPAPNVQTMYVNFGQIAAPGLLYYIMHKFKNLKDIYLAFYRYRGVLENAIGLQLLEFLANIPVVTIEHLQISTENVWSLLDHYIKSSKALQSMTIHTTPTPPLATQNRLVINKINNSRIQFEMDYCITSPEEERTNFIIKNGKFITRLYTNGCAIDLPDYENTGDSSVIIDGEYFSFVFEHCPKITSIGFSDVLLKNENWKIENDEHQPRTLKGLALYGCLIHETFLLQLSTLLSEVEVLSVNSKGSRFCDHEGEPTPFIVDVRHTSIGSIALDEFAFKYDDQRFILLHINTEVQGDLHYFLDQKSSTLMFNQCDKEVHDSMAESTYFKNIITLRCHDLKEVQLFSNSRYVTLKLDAIQ